MDPFSQVSIADGRDYLDPRIKVARHHVGAADVRRRLDRGDEPEDARVLEEPTENRDHPNVLRQTRDTWTQATDTAHDQIDRDAGLRGCIQLINHLSINERVHLQRDAGRSRSRVLARTSTNLFDDLATEMHRSSPNRVKALRAGKPCQLIEEVRDVSGDLFIARKDAEVGIGASGRWVVVARADVDVTPRTFSFATNDKSELAVSL